MPPYSWYSRLQQHCSRPLGQALRESCKQACWVQQQQQQQGLVGRMTHLPVQSSRDLDQQPAAMQMHQTAFQGMMQLWLWMPVVLPPVKLQLALGPALLPPKQQQRQQQQEQLTLLMQTNLRVHQAALQGHWKAAAVLLLIAAQLTQPTVLTVLATAATVQRKVSKPE